jgi:hypothetical protein
MILWRASEPSTGSSNEPFTTELLITMETIDNYCNYIELWYAMLNSLSSKGGEDYYDAIAYIEDMEPIFNPL